MEEFAMFEGLEYLITTFVDCLPYLIALYFVFDIIGSLIFNKR